MERQNINWVDSYNMYFWWKIKILENFKISKNSLSVTKKKKIFPPYWKHSIRINILTKMKRQHAVHDENVNVRKSKKNKKKKQLCDITNVRSGRPNKRRKKVRLSLSLFNTSLSLTRTTWCRIRSMMRISTILLQVYSQDLRKPNSCPTCSYLL